MQDMQMSRPEWCVGHYKTRYQMKTSLYAYKSKLPVSNVKGLCLCLFMRLMWMVFCVVGGDWEVCEGVRPSAG